MTTEPFDPATPEPVRPDEVRVLPTRKSRGTSGFVNLALGLALVVAAAGVAFAVGRATAPATTATQATPGGRNFPGGGFGGPNGPGASGAPNGGGFGLGAASIEGTVESATADSVTIRTSSGALITVGLSPATTYHEAATATAAAVEPGRRVVVRVDGLGRRGGPGASGAPSSSIAPSIGNARDVTLEP